MFLLFRKRSFYTVIVITLCLLAGGCYVVMQNQTAAPTLSWIMAEKTFLIDPGHGGTFPGRVNDNVLEKDINLDIALKLDQLLEETGARMVMTRRSDIDLIPQESKEQKLLLQQRDDLAQRIQIGAQAQADYFISIHCNSIPNEKWRGAQAFYNPEDPESKALAQSIQQMLVDFTKVLYPQKNGSVYDIKFSEKWEDSCDELEKLMIYKAAYKAYKTTNGMCCFGLVAMILLSFFFHYGPLPAMLVGCIWLAHTVSYYLEARRLEKEQINE